MTPARLFRSAAFYAIVPASIPALAWWLDGRMGGHWLWAILAMNYPMTVIHFHITYSRMWMLAQAPPEREVPLAVMGQGAHEFDQRASAQAKRAAVDPRFPSTSRPQPGQARSFAVIALIPNTQDDLRPIKDRIKREGSVFAYRNLDLLLVRGNVDPLDALPPT